MAPRNCTMPIYISMNILIGFCTIHLYITEMVGYIDHQVATGCNQLRKKSIGGVYVCSFQNCLEHLGGFDFTVNCGLRMIHRVGKFLFSAFFLELTWELIDLWWLACRLALEWRLESGVGSHKALIDDQDSLGSCLWITMLGNGWMGKH
jgi:hypothetical protein